MARSGGWVLIAAWLVAVSPAGVAGTGFGSTAEAATAAVSLDDVRLDLDRTLVAIPHLRATGSPLSAPELANLFDPARSETVEDRLAKFTASEVTAAEITVSGPSAPNKEGVTSITLHDVTLRDVVAGRIGSLSVRRVTSAPDAKGGSFATGSISASRIDLPLGLRIATGSRSDAAMPLQAVFEAFAIEAVSLVADDVKIEVGTLRSAALRGRPPLLPFSRLAALSHTPSSERSEADKQAIAKASFDTFESFASDHVELRDLALKSTGVDPTTLALGAFVIDGLDPGKVRLVAAEHFALTSKAADATIERVALEGYDQTRLLEAIKRQSLDQNWAIDADALRTSLGEAMPTLANLSLRAMRIDATADDFKGNARAGTRNVFDIPATDLKLKSDDTGAGTSSAHARIVYDIAPDSVDPGLLNMVEAGVPHLDVSLDYALGWNSATRRATLDRVSVAADALGSVSFGGSFGHLAPALFDPAHPAAASAAAQDVEVEAIHLDVGDAGLAAKLWALVATRAGVSVPLLKAEAKGQIEVALLKTFGNTPTATKLSSVLSTFIDEPKTLTLAIKAPAGLNMRAIALSGGGRELLDVLQIEATANK